MPASPEVPGGTAGEGIADADLPEPQVLRPTFVETYRHRLTPLVRLAVALTGSEEAAEDIVHDVFVRAHGRWDRIEAPDAYLRVAVVNACRSAARRARSERIALAKQTAEPSVPDPDEMFDALGVLSYRQRAAVVLRYYEGLTFPEIAEVLGCRAGTAASLVHRALARLRQVIDR